MTTLQKSSRADSVRQRRSTQKRSKPGPVSHATSSKQNTRTSRQAYHPSSVFLPGEPRPVAAASLGKKKDGSLQLVQRSSLRQAFGVSTPARSRSAPAGRMTKNPRRNGYDFAFSLGRTAVRAPMFNLPQLGPRWVSAGLTLLLGMLIYTMITANTFMVSALEITGNQRLSSEEVNAKLGIKGLSIFKAIPSEIEKTLRTTFPDLAGASVQVGFPNRIQIAVVERTPVLIWFQDDQTTWIDSNGVAFTPRGDVPGLVQISSSGNPPTPSADPDKIAYDQSFISPAMVQAILSLIPQVPSGAPIVYDPKYGVGWQDPQGWSVYFGQNIQEIDLKKKIYQSILDTFSQQGIHPTLISVAYLDAPFYK
jgi:hypothetical protein